MSDIIKLRVVREHDDRKSGDIIEADRITADQLMAYGLCEADPASVPPAKGDALDDMTPKQLLDYAHANNCDVADVDWADADAMRAALRKANEAAIAAHNSSIQ